MKMSRNSVLSLIPILFASSIAWGTVRDNGGSSTYYQKRTEFIGYPPYTLRDNERSRLQSDRELRYAYRINSFAYSDLTTAEAEKKAVEFRRQGFNLILSEGNRYLFNDDRAPKNSAAIKSPAYEDVIRNTKIMADACHRHGLKFFLHLTCTMIDKPLLDKHPDWACIDLATGKTIFNGYGTFNSCINNDDFMSEFYRRVERLIYETGADGIMQDEIQFFGPTLCGCRWCREKFKKETGYEIPDSLGGWLYHIDNPCYQAWLKWRREKVVENCLKIRNIIKKYGKDKTVITYLCNNTTSWAYYSAGFAINDFIKYVDSPGYECEPHDHFYLYYWPHIIYEMKYLRAVAEDIGTAPWTLFYDRTFGDYTWNWFLAMSQGSRRWWYTGDPAADKCWQPLIAWEEKHEKILMNVKSAANIGVLFSLDTRDRNPNAGRRVWIHGFSSTCNALTDGHVPYKVILEEDLKPGQLNTRINTLLLFNVGSMSDRAVEAVRCFVRDGGTLICSSETSLYNERGEKRADFALADVFGFSCAGECKDENSLLIPKQNDVTGDVTGKLKHEFPFWLLKNLQPDLRTLGTMLTSDGKEHPGILARNYGKGKVVYFAGHPEYKYLYHYYNENLVKPGEQWTDNRDPEYGRLLCRVAQYCNKGVPMIVGNLSKGIVAEAYRHDMGDLKGIQVHLANFLGGRLKEGIVPQLNDVTFPEVRPNLPDPSKPITISVRARDVKSVYLLSPDFDATVRLPVTRKGEYATVALPVLYRYFIIYFSQGSDRDILRLAQGRVVTRIPPAKKLLVEEKEPLAGKYDPNGVTVFADSKDFSGGLDFGWYKKEVCRLLYGSTSGVSVTTATLTLDRKLDRPVLDVGGMDDNQPSSHAPIEIKVNGRTVYKGPNTFPDQEWAVQSFPINAEDLHEGQNSIQIANTGEGPRGNIPWFGVSFVRLR